MLRALRWQENNGKLDGLLYFARRCVRPAAMTAGLFLLMRAELIADFAPFAPAFFAAALAAGESAAALVLGCLLGMLRLPLQDMTMISAVGCAGVLAGEILFSLVHRLHGISPETRASLNAGFGVLLPALAFARGNVLESMQALGCAALAAASAPFLLPALDLRFERKRLMTQEKIGFLLLAAGCLAGLRALYPPVARGAAVLMVLMLPELGAASGVLWGIALMGDGPELMAALAVCGAVSMLPVYTARWQRSLAVLAASAVLTLWTGALPFLESAAASMVYVIVPSVIIEKIGVLSARPEPDWDPERIGRDVTAESACRLRALGDAFAEMAEGCAVPGDVPDEQALICRMRERLCAGCPDMGECWSGGDGGAARFLCRLIEDALGRVDAPPGMRVLYSDGEVPPDILRFCRRGKMIPDRLGLLLRDFAEKRRAEIKRCATGRLLSVQLLQAREILYDLAERQSRPVHGRKLGALQAALDAAALDNCSVSAFGSDSAEIQLRKDDGWSRAEVRRAGEAVARSWNGDFMAELGGNVLRFRQKPRFSAETGSACQSGVAGQPCGDSHKIGYLGGTRLAAIISDGMGSGEAAAGESGETLRLLWRFLDAGISRPLALETVNQQMLMRTGDDMFATVDLCVVDLNTGVAEFSKLAACRTLVLRGGEALRVEGGRLPLGILEGVQSDVCRIRLKGGDVIVMGSDGVMELGDGLMIDRIARLSAHLPAQQLAEKLVREAAVRRSRGRSDDMTCICLRISADGQKKAGDQAKTNPIPL